MLSPGIPLGIGNQRFVIIPSEAGQTFTSRPAQHYRKSGRTGRCHNWLRRHPESFRRASQAIGMLSREKEIVWDVVSCINQQNIDTLPAFKEYLIELGVGQWRIFTIFPAGRAAQVPELQLSSSQFKKVLDFIRQTRQEGRIHVNFACEVF